MHFNVPKNKTIGKYVVLFIVFVNFVIGQNSGNCLGKTQNQYVTSGYVPAPVHKLMASNNSEKIVYLTFDDGPSASSDKLMDLLDKYHAKATFFLLQSNILKHPKEVERMNLEGFSLGLHGVTHDHRKLYRSKQTVVREMSEDQQTLMNIVKIKTPFIRTPYGSYPFMKNNYRQAINKKGFIMWDWNVDSHDWKYRNWRFNQVTINQIKKLNATNQIPVILLHDRFSTVQNIEPLLKYLELNHYKMNGIDATLHPLQFPVEFGKY